MLKTLQPLLGSPAADPALRGLLLWSVHPAVLLPPFSVGSDPWFEIVLIPHTLEVTVLGVRRVGDQVNLEMDVLAKYVERLMSK